MVTDTTTLDLGKLTNQANELRGAMVEALGQADDSKVRKLGNELATVNRQIIDLEATTQTDARDNYRDIMHDTLNAFELDGLTLTVKFDAEGDGPSIVFRPTDATILAIGDAVKAITRPSSATKRTYGRDEEGYQSFDFGKGAKRTGSANGGPRTVGWTTPDGRAIALGDAFAICATEAQKTELGKLSGGSATNAFKVKTITAAGYKKN